MKNPQSFLELEAFVSDLYRGHRAKLVPFQYPIAFENVVGGADGIGTLKINGNADFVVSGLIMTYPGALSDVFIQLTDSGSQETLFNAPVPYTQVSRIASLNNEDWDFGMPRRLYANSNQVLTIQNRNFAGSTLTAATLILSGVNVFLY